MTHIDQKWEDTKDDQRPSDSRDALVAKDLLQLSCSASCNASDAAPETNARAIRDDLIDHDKSFRKLQCEEQQQ